MLIYLTGIHWDTDNAIVLDQLPRNVTTDLDIAGQGEDDVTDLSCDWLSDRYGYCVLCLNWSLADPRQGNGLDLSELPVATALSDDDFQTDK